MQKSYRPPVIDAPATDFPFVAELPKREKSKLVKLWDAFRELAEFQEQHGFPVPRTAAAALLEVHPTRIDQLIADGRLMPHKFHGHIYISQNSLVAHARTERKTGRPQTQKLMDDCDKSPVAVARVVKNYVVNTVNESCKK